MINGKIEQSVEFKAIQEKIKDGTYTVTQGVTEARKLGYSFGVANPAIDAWIKDPSLLEEGSPVRAEV
jgi:hypothetical protein